MANTRLEMLRQIQDNRPRFIGCPELRCAPTTVASGRFGHVDGDGLALRRAAKSNATMLLLTTTVATFVLAFWVQIITLHPGWGKHRWRRGGGTKERRRGGCVWLSLAGERESSRQGGGLKGTGSDRCLIEGMRCCVWRRPRLCAATVVIKVYPGQSNVDDATLGPYCPVPRTQ